MPDLEVCGYGKRNGQLWKIFPRGGGDMRKIWIVFAAEIRKQQQHN